MRKQFLQSLSIAATLILAAGCENMPGTREQQGAVIGGAGGAIAGAAIGGEQNRLLGALIGGAIGAGGGYLIGANSDRIFNRDSEGARRASEHAQSAPATAQQAMNARTADVNNDGFVTLDEVVAMKQAGFPENTMLDRLHATGQVFELTPEQERYLRDNGVSQRVIREMENMNRETRDRLLSSPNAPLDSTISRELPR
jgi:hypothetical protein